MEEALTSLTVVPVQPLMAGSHRWKDHFVRVVGVVHQLQPVE